MVRLVLMGKKLLRSLNKCSLYFASSFPWRIALRPGRYPIPIYRPWATSATVDVARALPKRKSRMKVKKRLGNVSIGDIGALGGPKVSAEWLTCSEFIVKSIREVFFFSPKSLKKKHKFPKQIIIFFPVSLS